MTLYAAGKKARGICDICGRAYYLRQLKKVIRRRVPTGLKACPTCWDPQHPQDDQGMYRVHDPQVLREPRPDSAEYASSRALVFQIPEATAVVQLGIVTASI